MSADPPELNAVAETETETGSTTAAEELPGLSPDPDPTPYVDPNRRERARDLPGSVPAAVLILSFFVLELIGRAVVASNGETQPSRATDCISLIIGLGLLFGGRGFRDWGMIRFAGGLLVWPLLLMAGFFGPASVGSYLGLISNIGMIMLLAGVPSRKRVGWGNAVVVLGLLLGIAGSAFYPIAPGKSEAGGHYAEAVYGVPSHEPQVITFSKELGGVSLTVPSGLPQLSIKPHTQKSADGYDLRLDYSGTEGARMAGAIAMRMAPGYEYDLNAGADKIVSFKADGVNIQELSRATSKLGGKPSLRLECETSGLDGEILLARYELVRNGKYVYICFAGSIEPDFLQGDVVQEFFDSVKFPDK